MRYKELNYEYVNTGGNCMVGITEVWLPEENRTVFVYVNDHDCVVTPVDFIRKDIDVNDYEESAVDVLDYNELTGAQIVQNKYYELYRYCISKFIVDDYKKFKTCNLLPFVLLSDDLQRQVTPEYRIWHEKNVGRLYRTDGIHVMLDGSYIQDNTARQEKEKLTFALWQFKHAYKQLLETWQDAHYVDLNKLKANDKYPFTYSFDELEVVDWIDSVVDELHGNK